MFSPHLPHVSFGIRKWFTEKCHLKMPQICLLTIQGQGEYLICAEHGTFFQLWPGFRLGFILFSPSTLLVVHCSLTPGRHLLKTFVGENETHSRLTFLSGCWFTRWPSCHKLSSASWGSRRPKTPTHVLSSEGLKGNYKVWVVSCDTGEGQTARSHLR